MDAMVTVKFKYKNVCSVTDLEGSSFDEIVRELIREDGICSVIENYVIADVKIIKSEEIK